MARINAGVMSSSSSEWSTPQDLFDKLNALFHFDVDVAATSENAKCGRYYTREDSGLDKDWRGNCWMNPPYGDEIGLWMRKASESARQGATVVALVPSRTDTRWWQDWCASEEVFFVKGRLKFGGCPDGAPFPSAIVIFRPRITHTDLRGYMSRGL